jgi:hypothetical protein
MELSTRTPPKITEQIQALCRDLDNTQEPMYVPVQPDPDSKPLECFVNVRDKVERDGGRIRFGWAIWEWARVMIEAEFHANWISPGGEQIDITPKPEGISRILFLPASTDIYDYNREYYRIDNIRRPLADDPLVAEYIRATEEVFEFEERLSPGSYIDSENPAFELLNTMKERKARIFLELKSRFQPRPSYGQPGRNDPCPCGSGKKYKKCHGR